MKRSRSASSSDALVESGADDIAETDVSPLLMIAFFDVDACEGRAFTAETARSR